MNMINLNCTYRNTTIKKPECEYNRKKEKGKNLNFFCSLNCSTPYFYDKYMLSLTPQNHVII
jgi:hypothetical protein